MISTLGLVLLALGIVIVPLIISIARIGLNLNDLQNKKTSLWLLSTSLLAFVLIRPEGVHSINENGLSLILSLFGVNAGFNGEYINYYTTLSLVLLLVQIVLVFQLIKLIKTKNERNAIDVGK